MVETPPGQPEKEGAAFSQEVGAQAARKIQARRTPQGVWFGLGMMGLIGWSVVVPTLLGAGAGLWLDKHYPGQHSWTLTLLIGGLILGCANAWKWVVKEDQAMHDSKEKSDE